MVFLVRSCLDPRRLDEVREIVRPEDFHADANRRICSVISSPCETAGPVRSIPPYCWIGCARAGDLEAVGGAAYLAEVGSIRSRYAANAGHYAKIIRDKAESRHVIQAALEIVRDGYNGVSPGDFGSGLERTMERIDADSGIHYKRLSCAELDAGNYELEYLIDRTLVAGQPCIVAGGKKWLKTSIILDMGISLAVGGFFLGKLKVNRACKVGIMTGESGLATIQETAGESAERPGTGWATSAGWFSPKTCHSSAASTTKTPCAVSSWMTSWKCVAIDPAYLCLPGADAGNLFVQGDLLRGMSKVCTDTGCMMILGPPYPEDEDRSILSARVGRHCMGGFPRVCPSMVAGRPAGGIRAGDRRASVMAVCRWIGRPYRLVGRGHHRGHAGHGGRPILGSERNARRRGPQRGTGPQSGGEDGQGRRRHRDGIADGSRRMWP